MVLLIHKDYACMHACAAGGGCLIRYWFWKALRAHNLYLLGENSSNRYVFLVFIFHLNNMPSKGSLQTQKVLVASYSCFMRHLPDIHNHIQHIRNASVSCWVFFSHQLSHCQFSSVGGRARPTWSPMSCSNMRCYTLLNFFL